MALKLSWRRGGSGATDDAGKPISESALRGTAGRGCLVVFFGIFAVLGALVLWFVTLRPALQVFEARSWLQVPATVVSSEVETHSDSDGSTYSIEIRYTYRIDGRSYAGDRYHFVSGSSSGYQHKAEIVDRYPVGSKIVCRVDPDDPESSVISTEFDREYLFGLFGLPFLLVGLGGGAWALRCTRPRTGSRTWLPPVQREPGSHQPGFDGGAFAETGPLVLRSTLRPVWRFVAITIFAALWNGVVIFLLWPAMRQEGGFGCASVFFYVFAAIGVLVLISVPHAFLAMFNPRPTLTLDRARLVLGESCRVSWRWSGSSGRIARLRIVLEGKEEATYRRGTDTTTATSVFAEIEVVDTRTAPEIDRSSADLAIPANTMHSFEAPNNKIVWRLKLAAEIPNWPDVGEEHKLVIQPREKTG